ncbi:MAG TPA: ATPase, T2SS/T4P/T4SS family [Tepidisphaeraceae bacterium]|nr:ATPase, T2SS/T4P/T4SS family [Tepidisphaeraceae bacterium]
MSRIVPPATPAGSPAPQDPNRPQNLPPAVPPQGLPGQRPAAAAPAAPASGAIPVTRPPGSVLPGAKPVAPGASPAAANPGLRPPVKTVVTPPGSSAGAGYDVARPAGGNGAATPAAPQARPPVAGTPTPPRPASAAPTGTPASPRPAGAAPTGTPMARPTAAAPMARPAAASAQPPAARPAGAPGAAPGIEELKGRQIGRVLTKMGKVTREQVVEALDFQKKKSGALGRILVDLGYIKPEDLNAALAAQRGYQLVSLEGRNITPEMIKAVPPQIATTQKVLPIEFDPATKKLVVAMATHENFVALDDLRQQFGYNVTAVLADPDLLDKLISKHYTAAADNLSDLLSELNSDETLKGLANRGESIDIATMTEAADLAPVKKLINLVLLQAIRDKASDIHFEPFENEFKMRYRIDGVLYEMMPPPSHIAAAISSRVKVMANLDIAERRVPQDGRIELNVNNQPIDLRVSVLPTMFGESVVMRVLDRSNVSLDLDKLGLRDDDLNTIRQLIHKPNGICICTGPTGSGKTTTLYSALRELNDPSSKLITAEDPVEYDIDGIVQCQIKPDIELTFARILRSMLRQDPDTILIGEIRDKETAEIAVQASLTGHLVFSTLHTNDAPSAIARLLDLGMEPFLVTATLEGIIAQRLVRKICQSCKTPFTPSEEQLMELELRPDDVAGRSFYFGKGCEVCNNTGYKGHQGIYEIMLLDDDLRDMVIAHASSQVLRVEARKRGMRTLRQSGLMMIYDGITTIEEVVRETIMEE